MRSTLLSGSEFMESQSSQNKILIVEDDPDIGRIAQMILTKAEYSVRLATDGREALEIIALDAPHLVISDVMMPGMDGFELLACLKNDAATQAIPVMLMSAMTEDGDVRRGGISGAEYYLKKPFSAVQMTAAVKGVFATVSAKQRLDSNGDSMQIATP